MFENFLEVSSFREHLQNVLRGYKFIPEEALSWFIGEVWWEHSFRVEWALGPQNHVYSGGEVFIPFFGKLLLNYSYCLFPKGFLFFYCAYVLVGFAQECPAGVWIEMKLFVSSISLTMGTFLTAKSQECLEGCKLLWGEYQRYRETLQYGCCPGQGRRWCTTAREDREIVNACLRTIRACP